MNEFKNMAQEAAQLEISGNAKEAATAWRRAGEYCTKEQNREWCDARAEFCESRFIDGVDRRNYRPGMSIAEAKRTGSRGRVQ